MREAKTVLGGLPLPDIATLRATRLCWLKLLLGQRRSTVRAYNFNVCNICAATLGTDGDIEFKQMMRMAGA